MRSDDAELIVEHALSNESNLILAAKIGSAYPQLKTEVIRRFLSRLEADVQGALGADWATSIEREAKGAPALYVWKLKWPEDINIGIGSDNGCLSDVYLWVMRCGKKLKNALLDEEIRTALGKAGRSWKTTELSIWRCLDKYRDWGSQETLIDVYRASEALQYITAVLVDLARTVAPLIDGQLSPAKAQSDVRPTPVAP